jgi:septum formation protein
MMLPQGGVRPTLVLASASPARRATLEGAGIDPVVIVSHVDEDAVLGRLVAVQPDASPQAQVLALAQAKAREVAGGQVRGSIVLGCDSMLELDGEILGKPRDAADAVARITQQSGREAVLHTGHWLIDLRDVEQQGLDDAGGDDRGNTARVVWDRANGEVGAVSSTVVRFGTLSEAEIAAYVATGEPLHVAGAFTIDALGGPFIEGIVGDHHGVVGLSLPTLRHLLAALGLTVMDLWRR